MKILTNLKGRLSSIFTKLEHSVGPFLKVGIGALVLISAALIGSVLLSDKSEITNSTIMITTMDGRGGGSGSVIYSSDIKSLVLTNNHICEFAAHGALVKTNEGNTHLVTGFKQSKLHDLCLMTVAAKLPGKVSMATSAPKMFELATVSGHPALLPNVVTQGHFSGNKIIDVFMGIKECLDAEKKDIDLFETCLFFGGLPIIRTYEAVLVTATIMPGSSGSAIYNSNKELSAVVFAGSGELGYAFAVPYEYVRTFLTVETAILTEVRPNYNLDTKIIAKGSKDHKKRMANIIKKCNSETETISNIFEKIKIENFCRIIVRDFNWRM